MKDFMDYLTEVFDFSREDVSKLDQNTNLIHYYKNGEEKVSSHDGRVRIIPFKEFVFHTPLQNMPRDKSNLWVHVMHYPGGYFTTGLQKPHLQVHFDLSHVTDHDYLDEKRETEKSEKQPYTDPGYIYSKAFAKNDNLPIHLAAGGNAFKGVARDAGSGLSFAFRKIAPHIVKAAWHVSELYPKAHVAFSAGSDVPGHNKRKLAMYNTIANSLKDAGLVHDESHYVYNPYSQEGQLPMFHVVKPIH